MQAILLDRSLVVVDAGEPLAHHHRRFCRKERNQHHPHASSASSSICSVSLHTIDHPLVHDALMELRAVDTAPSAFRRAATRISLLLAAEALRSLPSVAETV